MAETCVIQSQSAVRTLFRQRGSHQSDMTTVLQAYLNKAGIPEKLKNRERTSESFSMISNQNAVKQMKLIFTPDAEKYKPQNPEIQSDIYKEQCRIADSLPEDVNMSENNDLPEHVWGMYEYIELEDEKGRIGHWLFVKPMPEQINNKNKEYATRTASLAHEIQHFIDSWDSQINEDPACANYIEYNMRIEWRAWAIQAAVAFEHRHKGIEMNFWEDLMLDCFLDDKLTITGEPFFRRSQNYLSMLENEQQKTDHKIEVNDADVQKFIDNHGGWILEAKTIFCDRCAGIPAE